MPRVQLELWDRLYLLKLVSISQMTFSSFTALMYCYLITLQSWISSENSRTDIMNFKWSVMAISILDFGNGTLLAFSCNQRRYYCVWGTMIWIITETFLIPISIYFLIQLNHKLTNSKPKHVTDVHYSRVLMVQIFFFLCQYFFMGYALDFLVYKKKRPVGYDPSIRPEEVDEPTDPKITTTESRHIRMSHSFLFQPSTSKKVLNYDRNEPSTSMNINDSRQEVSDWKDRRKMWIEEEEEEEEEDEDGDKEKTKDKDGDKEGSEKESKLTDTQIR